MSIVTAKRADMCYCPGCSHGGVLEALGTALDRLQRPAHTVCLVSDIGCIGTADRYFQCHTFHGLHGRSLCYAEGIKRASPGTLVVVLIGDGGCGIGTAHLVHAARRAADIKVVVCNNFNFGMTGGQHSPTTPCEARTTTTPGGAGDHPFDICATVAANGASFVARHDAFDRDLVVKLTEVLSAPGFALADIWELCTAYFVPSNQLNRGSLASLSTRLSMPFGTIHSAPRVKSERPSRKVTRDDINGARRRVEFPWARRVEMTVAGSAGQRIRTALGNIGELAVAAGHHAAQQDDFPITVRKGFSVSSLIVSPEPILYTGLDHPRLMVLLSKEGLDRVGDLSGLPSEAVVVADRELGLGSTPAQVVRIDSSNWDKDVSRETHSMAAVAFSLVAAGLTSAETLVSAAESGLSGTYREVNLRAIRAGAQRAAGEFGAVLAAAPGGST